MPILFYNELTSESQLGESWLLMNTKDYFFSKKNRGILAINVNGSLKGLDKLYPTHQ